MIKKILSVLKQIKINLKYIAKRSTIWTSSIIAISQTIGFLPDFNDIFPEDWIFIKRLLVSAAVVAVIWLIVCVIYCIIVLRNESIAVIDAKNGHHVFVEYGDLLADSDESKNVVVTVNRCFDTIVDNDLISRETIHGKIVNKICSGSYSAEMLNEALQNDLCEIKKIKPQQILLKKNKRKGNLKRYPVGSIAEFKKQPDDKTTYFFLGMSAFNSNLHPETTDKEYMITIQSLIEYCHLRSQKLPIYIPIIGTHGLDNKKSERELLEFMVNSLRFNEHLINTDIHIVVYSGQKSEVSIYGL